MTNVCQCHFSEAGMNNYCNDIETCRIPIWCCSFLIQVCLGLDILSELEVNFT